MRGVTPDEYMTITTPQSAFVYTNQLIAPGWSPPTQTGSELGVPPPANIAGQTSNGSDPAGTSYANRVTQRPAGSHPILWLIVLMLMGLVLLGWISHLEVKRRG